MKFIDKIVHHLRIIEEQYGFTPDGLVHAFASTLKLVKHQRFQFGLNNVFIFQGA